MVRWQDRGEVPDSDDEEVSLGGESQGSRQTAPFTGPIAAPLWSVEEDGVEATVGSSECAPWLNLATIEGATAVEDHATPLPGSEDVSASHVSAQAVDDDQPRPQPKSRPTWYTGLFAAPHDDDDATPHQASQNETTAAPMRDVELVSTSSSPLSSPSDSPTATVSNHEPALVSSLSSLPDPQVFVFDAPQGHDVNVGNPMHGRRSLRARQAKQLHPYMFEKEAYQRQCRERGIKPVRLEETAANAEETQEATNSLVSSQDHLEATFSSSPGFLRSSPMMIDLGAANGNVPNTEPHFSGINSDLSSDDDLPDIGALIAHSTAVPDHHRRKRRKLSTWEVERQRLPVQRSSAPLSDDDPPAAPLSPPGSSSSIRPIPKEALPTTAFRRPRGLSPAPLPTPEISSEVRPPPRVSQLPSPGKLSAQRSTRNAQDRPNQVQVISDESADDSEPAVAAPQIDERRLHKERRRIKGVLPASWLQIDLKAQRVTRGASASPARNASPSPTRGPPATQRGVARTLYRPHRRSPSVVPDDSDGGESDGSSAPRAVTTITSPLYADIHHAAAGDAEGYLDIDDIMENNWIDPMLAGSSRGPRKSGLFSRKQPRITQAFQRVRSSTTAVDRSGERKSQRSVQTGVGAHKRQKMDHVRSKAPRARTTSLPSLGILDAPREPSVIHEQLPTFVRLARRTASRSVNAARTSPTHKIVRLATRHDTEDASETLQEWRRGRIVPRADSASPGGRVSRPPLAPLRNHQRQTMLPDGHPTPSNERQHQPRSREPKSRLRQPRLDPYVASTTQALQRESHPKQSSEAPRAPQRPIARPTRPAIRYQTAQLESLETDDARVDRLTAFRRQIERMSSAAARLSLESDATGALYAQRQSRNTLTHGHDNFVGSATQAQAVTSPATTKPPMTRRSALHLVHRPRKRQAARLDVEAASYRQPVEVLPVVCEQPWHSPEELSSAGSQCTLEGLGPYGSCYTTDFDIRPLPHDTHFHHSTFIGSGDFAAATVFGSRDLDAAVGSLRIYIGADVYEWSAWTEEVSSAVASIPSAVYDALGTLHGLTGDDFIAQSAAAIANVDHMLRSTIRYLTRCLWFLDPIDRSSCVLRLQQLLYDLQDLASDDRLHLPQLQTLRRRMLQYSLVLARQTAVIASTTYTSSETRAKGEESCQSLARRLAAVVSSSQFEDLRQDYETCLRSDDRQLRSDDSVLASILILHHTLSGSSLIAWDALSASLAVNIEAMVSVRDFDKVWYSLFSLLPALSLSAAGRVLDPSQRDVLTLDWALPRMLVARCLELYSRTSNKHGSTMNEYIRAILARCYTLVTIWHAWTCEPTLGTIYDFFAKRGLGNLDYENSHGSPAFLEQLGGNSDLRLTPHEQSFHIFLKLIAVTISGLRQHSVYQDKKIASLTWRLIPNHARVYQRDAEVRQSDIEALRNHCDLLSTLYFAAPPSGRPSIRLLQDLVDLNTSHVEACRIVIKSWANLACFQSSSDEAPVSLEPLAAWYKDMVQITCNQYRLARSEAQQQYEEATAKGTMGITSDLLERTVATNQRQVAALLVDLLAGMRRAVVSAHNASRVLFLLQTAEPWRAFDSFDPSERRLLPVFTEALALIKTLSAFQPSSPKGDSQPASDDSQDYGDSSIFQDLDTDVARNEDFAVSQIISCLADHVTPLLSNAFGSESVPDDGLLVPLLDVWTGLGARLVQQGSHTWSNLVDDYSPGAWFQLRDTSQHRKYTPMFLARLVSISYAAFSSLQQTVLSAWLKSLVDRESALKYQHELTAALLRYQNEEPLLSNLPFVSPADGSDTMITLQELRERRLATISSVLSNMRDSYAAAMYADPQALPGLRRSYTDLLRQLMQAMKSNYQDLQIPGSSVVAGEAQGAYVTFVQQIVSALQQYTTDISPVDRFFTDSSVFPLPANDPEYVVGRLRAYVPKLNDAKMRKQLAVFVHTVSERAAVDGQQTYLAEQLATAMSGRQGLEARSSPTLRYVMLTSILPVYIEHALATTCSWVLALPVLAACTTVISELLHHVDVDNDQLRALAVEEVNAVLSAVQQVLGSWLAKQEALRDKHEVEATLGRALDLCRACIGLAHHVHRVRASDRKLTNKLRKQLKQAFAILEQRHDPTELPDVVGDGECDMLVTVPSAYADTRAFATKQLQDSLAKDWYEVNGRYYVRRGNTSREVVVSLDYTVGSNAGFGQAVERFEHSWDAVVGRRQLGRRKEDLEDLGLGELVV